MSEECTIEQIPEINRERLITDAKMEELLLEKRNSQSLCGVSQLRMEMLRTEKLKGGLVLVSEAMEMI